MLKKIFLFILCLAPWFLNNLIPVDYDYYKEIIKPFFAPPPLFYGIAWTTIYIFITITTFNVVTNYKYKEIPKSYKITLLINYLFNQSFTLVFFGLKSNFLGFISCLATLISTLFLYLETKNLINKKANYLIPYILLGIFATILSLSIYLLNI